MIINDIKLRTKPILLCCLADTLFIRERIRDTILLKKYRIIPIIIINTAASKSVLNIAIFLITTLI